MPALFVPHGGGPWPYVPNFAAAHRTLRPYLEGLSSTMPQRPRAILVVSAHWEQPLPTLQMAPRPPLLFDYSGFPPETYALEWPAPGAPELGEQIAAALGDAGIESAKDGSRGFDHGTFIVTKLAYPAADIPTLQLSLCGDLDPRRHLELGRALSGLRDEGVFILGSGMSYHNMRGFGALRGGETGPAEDARAFQAWLQETVVAEPSERYQRLIEWASAPSARACHPREEHLLPLMVVAGSALEDDAPTVPFAGEVLGVQTLAAQFG